MKNSNPYIKKDGKFYRTTREGKKYLERIVTDPEGDVYAFTGEANPLMVAAAMARLSRRGDDMRTILLDEFAASEPENMEGLIHRCLTAYGHDSVQQLFPIALVVENASNLLTKGLEWGRLAAYLEQSTRYIYYDRKDEYGRYPYFVPQLEGGLRRRYVASMDGIFDRYSEVVRGITKHLRAKIKEPSDKADRRAWLGATRAQACDAARAMLPAATASTVGIVASAQAVDNMIMNLAASPLEEFRKTARSLLNNVRKISPTFFERTDMPERGMATIHHKMSIRGSIRDFVMENYPGGASLDKSEVSLIDYWPLNELDLVPEILYANSHLSMFEIMREVSGWSDEDKLRVLSRAIGERFHYRHKPGRAFEKIHYEWELLIDYGIFRDLQRHRMLDMPEWQELTPYHGYDVPELVKETGYEWLFAECFEISRELYEAMASLPESEALCPSALAQYATLFGHKMRFRFMENLREAFYLHELRTSPQGHPGYRKVVLEMHTKLCKVHPAVGRAMKFVNKGEDPELTRLAAELAAQKKLEFLSEKTR